MRGSFARIAERAAAERRLRLVVSSTPTHLPDMSANGRAFDIQAEFEPMGDQPRAIAELTEGLKRGDQHQTLLGATGTGKTFTISHVLQNAGMPVLVMSHNKTLAAQLYAELRSFFPDNAVEFFISYYDYYQPEAYIVHSDTYIEKDMSINDRIDRLRLRATSSLVSGRKDVIVVASVSCIYGLGSPEEFSTQIVQLKRGETIERNELLHRLISIFYARNDVEFEPGRFRVRGDVVDIFPAYMEENAYRIEFWGDEIDRISVIDAFTGEVEYEEDLVTVYPAKIFVTPRDQLEKAIKSIEEELRWRLAVLREEGMMLEAQRLEQRTLFDIEMMEEVGYCSGIENYSRHLSDRKPGERPYCLMDYFPEDYLLVVDESHQTVPQINAMYGGDRSRKTELVEHGFRLPSALDNRPLMFEEWEGMINQAIFVSATPSDYELEKSNGVFVEQIIRPTGLMEPEIEVRPLDSQVDDILEEIRLREGKNERILCITLTKRLSEELSEYLKNLGIPAAYMHSELDAMQRVEVLYKYRRGDFKVLVGINLLREGIDIPELSLVAVMDADKEGFLRSETSLFQIVGRAARNVKGKAILYANRVTKSMQKVIDETNRRREIQKEYNEKHGITPTTIQKELKPLVDPALISTQDFTLDQPGSKAEEPLEIVKVADDGIHYKANPAMKEVTFESKEDFLEYLRESMYHSAKNMEFEEAARIRDQIATLEKEL